MKIGDIIDRLNKREPLVVIAKQLGLMPHTLSKKLRSFGYEYDSEKKKRVFVGEGEEPRDQSIFGEVPHAAPAEAAHDYQQLMLEELRLIRALLENRHSCVALPEEEQERVRRSFILPASLVSRLDDISSKRGIQKSKLVEEALRSLFERNGR